MSSQELIVCKHKLTNLALELNLVKWYSHGDDWWQPEVLVWTEFVLFVQASGDYGGVYLAKTANFE